MAKIIKLTESDLRRIVKKVIKEQTSTEERVQKAVTAYITLGLSELPTLINGSGTSDVKVKEICNICNNSKVQITQQSNQQADTIRDAVQGAGTNEQSIFDVIKSLRSVQEFCALSKSYLQSYGVDLYTDLDDDIDQESEWVQIYRPLRDMILRDNQAQQQQPVAQPTKAQSSIPRNQQTNAPRPTTAQSPTSRMPVR